MQQTTIPEPPLAKFLFANTGVSLLWLLVRLYVGWQWLIAGYEKIMSPVWVGSKAGSALQGFVFAALKKTAGQHPDVSSWYASFLQTIVLHNSVLFSYIVSFGEVVVGVALVLGMFTGIAAFFACFMNMNYLFAGTVSINPLLFLLELFLLLAWRVAGWIGIDRWLLPFLGTPWSKGKKINKF